MKVIPTIFAHNKKQFKERFNKLLPISKNLQIDFMDGKFVKAKSVQLSAVPNLKKYKNKFEAHLMVKNPDSWIKKLKQKGFKKIIFHIETKNPDKTIKEIIELKLQPWLAINPNTNINKLSPYLNKINGVLFMGIQPGKEHQHFLPKVLTKIKQFRKKSKVKIQVDGGVSPRTAPSLAKAGVNYINSGSFIADAENPKEAFNALNRLFKK